MSDETNVQVDVSVDTVGTVAAFADDAAVVSAKFMRHVAEQPATRSRTPRITAAARAELHAYFDECDYGRDKTMPQDGSLLDAIIERHGLKREQASRQLRGWKAKKFKRADGGVSHQDAEEQQCEEPAVDASPSSSSDKVPSYVIATTTASSALPQVSPDLSSAAPPSSTSTVAAAQEIQTPALLSSSRLDDSVPQAQQTASVGGAFQLGVTAVAAAGASYYEAGPEPPPTAVSPSDSYRAQHGGRSPLHQTSCASPKDNSSADFGSSYADSCVDRAQSHAAFAPIGEGGLNPNAYADTSLESNGRNDDALSGKELLDAYAYYLQQSQGAGDNNNNGLLNANASSLASASGGDGVNSLGVCANALGSGGVASPSIGAVAAASGMYSSNDAYSNSTYNSYGTGMGLTSAPMTPAVSAQVQSRSLDGVGSNLYGSSSMSAYAPSALENYSHAGLTAAIQQPMQSLGGYQQSINVSGNNSLQQMLSDYGMGIGNGYSQLQSYSGPAGYGINQRAAQDCINAAAYGGNASAGNYGTVNQQQQQPPLGTDPVACYKMYLAYMNIIMGQNNNGSTNS